ncbi:MAG: PAS domain S-box protein [Anaerolineales bacterium]|nr:PAS domain S-box protein [Anaerolineales bacterium]
MTKKKTKSELLVELEQSTKRIGELESLLADKNVGLPTPFSLQTKLKDSQALFQTLFNLSPVAYALVRAADRLIVDVNPACEHLFGYAKSEIVGKVSTSMDYWVDPHEHQRLADELAIMGKIDNFEFAYKTKSGGFGWAITYAAPVFQDGEKYVLSSYVNITKRKEDERQNILMKRLYATLSQVNDTIMQVPNVADLYQMICDAAIKFGEMPLVWIGLLDETSGELRPSFASGVDLSQRLLPTNYFYEEHHKSSQAVIALKSKRVVTFEKDQVDYRTDEFSYLSQMEGWMAVAIIPFCLKNKSIGTLTLVSNEKGSFSSDEEHVLLEEMGVNISFALDKLQTEVERQQAELALQERELKLKKLLEILPVGVCILNAEMQIVFSNPALQNILHISGEEFKNEHYRLRKYLRPDGSPMFSEHFAHVQAQKNKRVVYDVETGFVIEDGTIIWLSVSAVPVDFPDWKTVVVITDVTERKKMEDSLRMSEHRLREAQRLSHIGNWEWNLTTGETRWSEEIYAMHGMNQDAPPLTPERLLLTVYPDDLAKVKAAIGQAISEGTPVDIEYRIFHANGSVRVIHGVGAVTEWDADGKPFLMLGTNQDITERKQTEIALRESEDKFRKAFITSPDSININRIEDGLYVAINQGFTKTTGYTEAEVIGRSSLDIQIWARLEDRLNLVRGLSKDGFVNNLEAHFRMKNGEIRYGLMSAAIIMLGNVPHILSITRDITERKRAEEKLQTLNAELEQRVANRTEELEKANLELQNAMRAKDTFLANMSHELRTPLNGILGMAEILLEEYRGPLNDRQREYIHNIETSGHYLLSLINDILDLEKIKSGKMDLNVEPVSLTEICQTSLAFIEQPAMQKGVSMEFHPPEQEILFLADGRRIKQMLANLLGNAVKFTPGPGKVTLEVKLNRIDHQIEFYITDTGIGISPEDQKRLFTPFTQLDTGLTRNYEGTGLGLALVKHLVDLHRGSISLESTLGTGSRFIISLPWRVPPPTPSSPQVLPERPVQEDKQVKNMATLLLVEDNRINSMAIGEYLNDKGYSLIYAYDGLEALVKAAENVPDLILMDVQMPQMDGLEAIRHLRTDPQFAATPIIALTAYAMPGDREKCFAAGATDYMSKPIRYANLIVMIEKLLRE